jgi:putative FmdB family regulatory protein
VPIYEYICESCGAELEKLQKFSDPVLLTCPECGKDSLKKKISAASFHLKGTGWYETDFKNAKKKGSDDQTDKAGTDKSPNESKDGGSSASDNKTTKKDAQGS